MKPSGPPEELEKRREEMKEKEAKAVDHFVKCFVKAVREFGESERAKYRFCFLGRPSLKRSITSMRRLGRRMRRMRRKQRMMRKMMKGNQIDG